MGDQCHFSPPLVHGATCMWAYRAGSRIALAGVHGLRWVRRAREDVYARVRTYKRRTVLSICIYVSERIRANTAAAELYDQPCVPHMQWKHVKMLGTNRTRGP